ncbi:hypothetical protein [Microbacterium xylanilyticum]
MAQRKNTPAEEPTSDTTPPAEDDASIDPNGAPPADDVPVFAPAEEPTSDTTPPAEDDASIDPNGAPPADDVPVFAPAEEPAPAEETFITTLPDWLQDNYRQLVGDPNRDDSFTKLADRSTGALAAWARHEAQLAGEDITPTDAKPAGPDTTRSEEA